MLFVSKTCANILMVGLIFIHHGISPTCILLRMILTMNNNNSNNINNILFRIMLVILMMTSRTYRHQQIILKQHIRKFKQKTTITLQQLHQQHTKNLYSKFVIFASCRTGWYVSPPRPIPSTTQLSSSSAWTVPQTQSCNCKSAWMVIRAVPKVEITIGGWF